MTCQALPVRLPAIEKGSKDHYLLLSGYRGEPLGHVYMLDSDESASRTKKRNIKSVQNAEQAQHRTTIDLCTSSDCGSLKKDLKYFKLA